jgi:hypothetical protein
MEDATRCKISGALCAISVPAIEQQYKLTSEKQVGNREALRCNCSPIMTFTISSNCCFKEVFLLQMFVHFTVIGLMKRWLHH